MFIIKIYLFIPYILFFFYFYWSFLKNTRTSAHSFHAFKPRIRTWNPFASCIDRSELSMHSATGVGESRWDKVPINMQED